MMHCRKDGLGNISFDFAVEEYCKNVRALTKLEQSSIKKKYLNPIKNIFGVIMKLLVPF